MQKFSVIIPAHNEAHYIVTSCRKFDRFGDWYLFKNPLLVKRIFSGQDRKAADHFYYDPGR